MTTVHCAAMMSAQKGCMKSLKLSVLAVLSLVALPAQADDDERQEIYSSLLSCAAFHTIEATKTSGDASAAQTATAYDYANAATVFAADGKSVTVNAELKTLLESFKQKLDTGEPRAMAEQWTALESACQELHVAKDALVAKRKAELGGVDSDAR
jgi:hypothetical protein